MEIEILEIHGFEGENPHSVGEEATVMYLCEKDAFLGNWKGYVMGVSGCAESEITEEKSDAIIDSDAFSGDLAHVQATQISTQAGNPHTLYTWSQVEATAE